jgi:hypothetical protein
VGSLFFFELVSIIPSSYTEAGKLSLGLFNYINGLFLGVDSPFTGSDVHMTFTGPGADDCSLNSYKLKLQHLYTLPFEVIEVCKMW